MLDGEAIRARAWNVGVLLQRLDTGEHVIGLRFIEERLHICIAVGVAAQHSGVELLDEVVGSGHGLALGHHHATGVNAGAFGAERQVLVFDGLEERPVVLSQGTVEEPLHNTLHVVTLTLGRSEVRQQHVGGRLVHGVTHLVVHDPLRTLVGQIGHGRVGLLNIDKHTGCVEALLILTLDGLALFVVGSGVEFQITLGPDCCAACLGHGARHTDGVLDALLEIFQRELATGCKDVVHLLVQAGFAALDGDQATHLAQFSFGQVAQLHTAGDVEHGRRAGNLRLGRALCEPATQHLYSRGQHGIHHLVVLRTQLRCGLAGITEDVVQAAVALVLTGRVVHRLEFTDQAVGVVADVDAAILGFLEQAGDVEQLGAALTEGIHCGHSVLLVVVLTGQSEAARAIWVVDAFDCSHALGHRLEVHERATCCAVADVAAGLADQIAGSVIVEANTDLVQGVFDGVPKPGDDVGVQHPGEVSEVFFSGLLARHLAGLHGRVHSSLDLGTGVVHRIEGSVQFLRSQQTTEAEVAQRLVRQHKLQLLLSDNPVSEDDDIAITERVAHGTGRIEVALWARCHRLRVEGWVLGFEVRLVAVNLHLGFDAQLGQERTDQHLHTSQRDRVVDWRAIVAEVAAIAEVVSAANVEVVQRERRFVVVVGRDVVLVDDPLTLGLHVGSDLLSAHTVHALDGAHEWTAVFVEVVSQHVAVLINERLHVRGAGSSPQITQLLGGVVTLGLVQRNRLGVQFLDVIRQRRGGVGAGVVLYVGTGLASDAADWANAGFERLFDRVGWQVGNAQLAGVQHLGGRINRQALDHGGDLGQQATLDSVIEPRLGVALDCTALGCIAFVNRLDFFLGVDQFDQHGVDGVLLGVGKAGGRHQITGTQNRSNDVGVLASDVSELDHGADGIAEVTDVSGPFGSSELAVDQLQWGFFHVAKDFLGPLHGGLASVHILTPLGAHRCGQIVKRRSAFGLHVLPRFGRRKGFNLYRSGDGGGCRHGFWGLGCLLLYFLLFPALESDAATACLSAACFDFGLGLVPNVPPALYSRIILLTFCDTTLLELPFLSGTWSLLDFDRSDTGLLFQATLGTGFRHRCFGSSRGGLNGFLAASGFERGHRGLTLLRDQRQLGAALGSSLWNLNCGYG